MSTSPEDTTPLKPKHLSATNPASIRHCRTLFACSIRTLHALTTQPKDAAETECAHMIAVQVQRAATAEFKMLKDAVQTKRQILSRLLEVVIWGKQVGWATKCLICVGGRQGCRGWGEAEGAHTY